MRIRNGAPWNGVTYLPPHGERRHQQRSFDEQRVRRCITELDRARTVLRRGPVANIIDALKEDGSMTRMFAVYGVKYLDASSALAGKKLARDAN
jgi:hypothetical protein